MRTNNGATDSAESKTIPSYAGGIAITAIVLLAAIRYGIVKVGVK